jgi:hypothetical protein
MGRSLQHITGCEKALPGRDQGGEGSHPVKDLGMVLGGVVGSRNVGLSYH